MVMKRGGDSSGKRAFVKWKVILMLSELTFSPPSLLQQTERVISDFYISLISILALMILNVQLQT
jgi:hypothetical protein